MKKIIYLNELEVNLGDYIEIGGMIVIVTQELIDSNPNKFKITEKVPEYVKCIKRVMCLPSCFKVDEIYKIIDGFIGVNGSRSTYWKSPNGQEAFIESTKEEYELQELIKEAESKYPAGTRFYSALPGIAPIKCTSNGRASYQHVVGNHKNIIWGHSNNKEKCGWLYCNGIWAEILPEKEPLFQDSLGNNIYKLDSLVLVYPNLQTYNITVCNWRPEIEPKTKSFINKCDADEYIRRNQILLTTEDGVKIKSKESVYWVCYNEDSEFDFLYEYGFIKEITETEHDIVKYFATKENAEKYILSNLYKG